MGGLCHPKQRRCFQDHGEAEAEPPNAVSFLLNHRLGQLFSKSTTKKPICVHRGPFEIKDTWHVSVMEKSCHVQASSLGSPPPHWS